jgi:hypothetical protein
MFDIQKAKRTELGLKPASALDRFAERGSQTVLMAETMA